MFGSFLRLFRVYYGQTVFRGSIAIFDRYVDDLRGSWIPNQKILRSKLCDHHALRLSKFSHDPGSIQIAIVWEGPLRTARPIGKHARNCIQQARCFSQKLHDPFFWTGKNWNSLQHITTWTLSSKHSDSFYTKLARHTVASFEKTTKSKPSLKAYNHNTQQCAISFS